MSTANDREQVEVPLQLLAQWERRHHERIMQAMPVQFIKDDFACFMQVA
jgi:hypothetical protein